MQREVVLIFGQTGSGKTWKAKEILGRLPRALVIEAGFGEFPVHESFWNFEDLVLRLDEWRAFSDLSNFPARPPRSYVPFRFSWSPLGHEHPLVFDCAKALGNCTLVLDEADRFGDSRFLPEYDEIITRGRHYRISIVAVALHPSKLPKDLRRQCTSLISYRQIDPDDVEALAEICGEAAYELPHLPGPDPRLRPPFPALHWDQLRGARILDPSGAPWRPRNFQPPPAPRIRRDPAPGAAPGAPSPGEPARADLATDQPPQGGVDV